MQRRLPDPAYLRSILKFDHPLAGLSTATRLKRAQTIGDLKVLARRATPKGPFEYVAGAAENEVGLQRAYDAFRDVEFHPAVLRDVSHVTTGWDVLGAPVAFPFGIAPTGFTRLMHTDGERAGAAAAAKFGVPFALSTMGTTSPEDTRAAAGEDARLFFQLYLMRNREQSYALMERAWAAGFEALLVTVDTPLAGARHRDARNGMSFPPRLTWRTLPDAALRTRWWFDLLTTEPMEFAAVSQFDGTPSELVESMFDPSISYADIEDVRDRWPGKLVVKGIQSLADARAMADLGVDAIQLSNHGGRQLDRAPVPLRLLPEVVREVGRDVEIHVDTGIMSGADVVACVAQGARYAQVGRAYLYGLMAGGQAGVERALEILTGEITRVLKLLGVHCLEELEPRHVTLLDAQRG